MATLRRLRWWIVALVCVGTILNYLARNSLGVLAPQLTQELGFTTQQYSWVVAAFQLAYTAMQPVCGAIAGLAQYRFIAGQRFTPMVRQDAAQA